MAICIILILVAIVVIYSKINRRKKIIIIATTFLLFAVASISTTIYQNNREWNSKPHEAIYGNLPAEREPDVNKTTVYIVARNFVDDQLKAPSTSDYPWYDESFVKSNGAGKFTVCAYVDAQNSFGAKLRNKWCCELKYKSGEPLDKRNWELLNLAFDN